VAAMVTIMFIIFQGKLFQTREAKIVLASNIRQSWLWYVVGRRWGNERSKHARVPTRNQLLPKLQKRVRAHWRLKALTIMAC
jgi:membrane protein DedA with SNARE-associated domain